MAAFDLIELSLDPLDVTPTLEDEFTSTVIKNEIDNLDDIEHVKNCIKAISYISNAKTSNNTSISQTSSCR